MTPIFVETADGIRIVIPIKDIYNQIYSIFQKESFENLYTVLFAGGLLIIYIYLSILNFYLHIFFTIDKRNAIPKNSISME